jgi:hypothetical protein
MFECVTNTVVTGIGKVRWEFIPAAFNSGKYYKLTNNEQIILRRKLEQNHYIILTRRDTHLSTYCQNVVELIMRGKWGFWSHCAMNAEDEVTTDEDFRIIEAVGRGVIYSEFKDVFDCDSAALLIPKGFTPEDWTLALTDAAKQFGKGYDTVFDFLNDSEMSCIELIRHALKAVPNYAQRFPNFEAMLVKYGKLTPQMLYNSGEFDIAYEIRH